MSREGIKDQHHITPEWELLGDRIQGVEVREIRHHITKNGSTTEVMRTDWPEVGVDVRHVIHVELKAGAVSAWHMHHQQTDHLFVVKGRMRLAAYDDREGSPTRGKLDVFHLSPLRPQLVVIPPSVWHGIENQHHETSTFINYTDQSYRYEDPDEWRLPPSNDLIPFSFA